MVTSGRAVLSFDDTGDVWVFASLQDAASWMEAVDVEAGEYDAGVFTHDGHIVEVTTLGDRTVLDVRPERDEPRVWALLAEGRPGLSPTTSEDVLRFVNEQLRWEWERRWPTRPRWLHRRMHGVTPPQA